MLTSPHLITPDPAHLVVSAQDQPLQPLVDGTDAGNLPGSPLCVGWVRMRPGAVSAPHVHESTWVYVLLWSAGPLGAVTLYGDSLAGRIYQRPGQLLVIPPGLAHAAANPSPHHHVVAWEFRGSPAIGLDNVVREDLRVSLDSQTPVLFDLGAATA